MGEEFSSAAFNQRYARFLGLFTSFTTGNIVDRTHKGKKFRSFHLFREEVQRLRKQEAVQANPNSLKAFQFFERAVAMMCLPDDKMPLHKKVELHDLLFAMGLFSVEAMEDANKKSGFSFDLAFADMMIAAKFALAAIYGLEIIRDEDLKELSTEQTVTRMHYLTDKDTLQRFAAMSAEGVQIILTQSSMVMRATHSAFFERKRSTFKRGEIKKPKQPKPRPVGTNVSVQARPIGSFSKLFGRGNGTQATQVTQANTAEDSALQAANPFVRTADGVLKYQKVDKQSKAILRAVLMIDIIFAAFNDGALAGLCSNDLDYSTELVKGMYSLWMEEAHVTDKKFSKASVVIDEFNSTVLTMTDSKNVDVLDSNTHEQKLSFKATDKGVLKAMGVYNDSEGDNYLLLGTSAPEPRVELYNLSVRDNAGDVLRDFRPLNVHKDVVALTMDAFQGEVSVASADGYITVWDIEDRSQTEAISCKDAITCLATDEKRSTNGALEPAKVMVAGFKRGDIRCWTLLQDKKEIIWELKKAHDNPVVAIATADNEVYSADKSVVRVWDIGTKSRMKSFKNIHSKDITNIAISSDQLFTTGKDKDLKIFDLTSWRMLKAIHLQHPISSLQVTRNGDLVTGGKNGIIFWNVQGLLYGTSLVNVIEDAAQPTALANGGQFGNSELGNSSSKNFVPFSQVGLDENTNQPGPPQEGLNEILHNPKARRLFLAYLKQSIAEENLLFWIDVTRYEALHGVASERGCRREAKRIIDLYVRQDSPLQVNLSGTDRSDLENETNFKVDTFEAAKNVVVDLMHRNSYTGFMRQYTPEQENEE